MDETATNNIDFVNIERACGMISAIRAKKEVDEDRQKLYDKIDDFCINRANGVYDEEAGLRQDVFEMLCVEDDPSQWPTLSTFDLKCICDEIDKLHSLII